MSRAEALALLARAEVIHVAAALERPLLRPLHGVVVDDRLAWHCSLRGEKDAMLGRPVQVAAHEKVAEIPSHFRDATNACPATTYYESVLAEGVPREVADPGLKARILQALMVKYQPEGGHHAIRAEDPAYRSRLQGVQVVAMPIDFLSGKSKLGQNRKPEELAIILERLWERGAPRDLRAVDRILAANSATPTPSFLRAPAGFALRAAPGREHLPALLALLDGQYWTEGEAPAAIAGAHLNSGWVAAVGANDGRLLASGRAIGDGLRAAWFVDLVVREDLRRRGLGSALLTLLMAHPAARDARTLRLRTRDAQSFCARFGFRAEDGDVMCIRRKG
jgi:nitroimidazol reductase NimA-like FMN-containing flavoprotein (pyridoxamine 5'-phosphate oxidase superfamily)/GNAT superfamily N-acetyltransferase